MIKNKKLLMIIIIILIITSNIIFIGFAFYRWLFPDYTDWKEIEIDKVGSFYVPEEWIFTKDGTIIYFTDKPITDENYKIYLIGTEWDENKTYIDIEDIYPQYKKIDYENVTLLSNSATYQEAVFKTNNEKEKKFYISFFGNTNRLHLYAWDNLLDNKTIKKIAKSYLR